MSGGDLLFLRCSGIQCAKSVLNSGSQETGCAVVRGHEIFCREGSLHLSFNTSRV